jgi:hypothetical protein
MARPKNTDNRYSLTCKVTGETTKTNPKQFKALTERYNITASELDNSYVSRKGRKVIENEKLSPENAVEKYDIHINVANSLKCTVKLEQQKPEQVDGQVEVTNSQTVENADETSVLETVESTEEEETVTV